MSSRMWLMSCIAKTIGSVVSIGLGNSHPRVVETTELDKSLLDEGSKIKVSAVHVVWMVDFDFIYYLIKIVFNIVFANETWRFVWSFDLLIWLAKVDGSWSWFGACSTACSNPAPCVIIVELAVILHLHLRMAARIVLTFHGGCVTCKTAQVQPTRWDQWTL